MGLQALQDFVESHCSKAIEQVEIKEFMKARQGAGSKAVLVIDAMSCVRYLYGYNSDWVCGGQWNEMLRNIENFVRAFRQQSTEIVVFLAGEGDSLKLHEWMKTQEKHRQTVHKVLSHVARQANFPPKRLFFLPPAAQFCLRLAFRSCGVSVCTSIVDLHKELVLYSKTRRYGAIIGHHGDYLMLDPPAYLSADKLTFNKKVVSSCKFNIDAVFDELGLKQSHRGLFASLLGNSFIPEEHLAHFHWALLGTDHPLAKNQANGQSVLPPCNVVIRALVQYVNNVADVSNYSWIASQVFTGDSVNLEEMTDRLRESIEYYSGLQSKAPQDNGIDAKSKKGRGQNEYEYQKLWQHWQQRQQIVPPPPVSSKTMEEAATDVQKLEEDLSKLAVSNGESTNMEPDVVPKSPIAAPNAPGEAIAPSTPSFQSEPLTPPASFPTPPPSEEATPPAKSAAVSNGQQADNKLDGIQIRGVITSLTPQVLNTVLQRHQAGQMSEIIYQILTKAEVTVSAALEDENNTDILPTPLLYRPIRQKVYGLLFDKKAYDKKQGTMPHDAPPIVKEWCVYAGKKLNKPDLVEGTIMQWDVPELHPLWFGKEPSDDQNRMKAFLTCMQSDTPNMTKTTMVPQRLVIMCCVLRYLLMQGKGRPIILPHELDAFLAAALSPHISTECNPSNLMGLKLPRVDMRGVQLASIFMRGVEAAALANDACGCPVPWELVCPWNYFDGKLFMSKYIMASNDVGQLELCDGKNARLEKLQRMRWCIVEKIPQEFLGMRLPPMGGRFPGAGLLPTPPPFFPFHGMPMPMPNFIPAGANIPSPPSLLSERPRTRGASSKRPVSGLGGTLEVAGVPVAKWGGNKAGRGYDERNRIIAGGPMSVEMSFRGRRGRRGGNRGRGGGANWAGTRNVTWAVEPDADYDRRIGYKEPVPRMDPSNDQVRKGGDGGNDTVAFRGLADGGSDIDIASGEQLNASTSFPVPGIPLMGIPAPLMQPPHSLIGDKEPENPATPPLHILAKPADKLSTQGRGRGLPVGASNGPATDTEAAIGRGRAWWLEQSQQPAT
ncbi:constitutive coactivator of PPAR-gamma-like protein 1 [Nematostella vectensis]|uniref:constitutive coactivator of PPAR-gamma-like protein 1 n=1 Tax=Nematostella vectensis TaxID=45351 RepID=UPI0013903037|nr:constitutive coactivator of PPAR-gamma-like protein 1 [Nematostella vectensis]